MQQSTLNGRQARWLIQLAPHDFTIHYRKGKLNPADGPSRRPDYVADEGPDTAVARLMPTLWNKLASASPGACERESVQGSDPCAVSLIRAVSSQAITRSAARLAITRRSVDSLEQESSKKGTFVSTKSALHPEEVPDQPSTVSFPNGTPLEFPRAPLSDEASSKPSEEVVLETPPPEARSILKLIKDAQESDPQCRRIVSRFHVRSQIGTPLALEPRSVPQLYSVDGEGLLTFVDRVFVPAQEALRSQLLEVYHDCPSGGHWGRDKTLDLIRRRFTWPGIAEDVKEYVATCPVCQGKAIHRHKPYGTLEPLPVGLDVRPFKEISLDWITGLPTSMRKDQEYDSILTIVCRATKYALFIPTREDATAVDLAELFFEHVECRFGTPQGVVSDRDSRITSQFWREICEIQMIKRRLSTAYHPQTDGQSEVLNRIVEDYLRAYSSEDQTAWARLLPLAQFAYNNSRNFTTGMSPNRALFGYDCEIRIDVADTVSERRIPAARDRIEKLQELRQQLRGRLIEAQERMARYYNAKHVPKQFKVREFVKLSTKNLKFKHRKLSPRWIGPFRVLERIGGQAYRLALPDKYSRLHDVFPVQLIESYRRRDDDDSLMAMPDLEDPQDEWEVEEVLDRCKIKDTVHYLVKWVGWPSEYNSYEPAAHLANAPKLVDAYERKLKRKRKGKDTSESRKRSRKDDDD